MGYFLELTRVKKEELNPYYLYDWLPNLKIYDVHRGSEYNRKKYNHNCFYVRENLLMVENGSRAASHLVSLMSDFYEHSIIGEEEESASKYDFEINTWVHTRSHFLELLEYLIVYTEEEEDLVFSHESLKNVQTQLENSDSDAFYYVFRFC